MLILLCAFTLVVVGQGFRFWMAGHGGVWSYRLYDGAVFVSGLGAFALAVGSIVAPLSRMSDRASLVQIEALRATVENARATGDGLEGAAFRMKIAEANGWLAEAKFYRTTVFALWRAPEVETAEPVQ